MSPLVAAAEIQQILILAFQKTSLAGLIPQCFLTNLIKLTHPKEHGCLFRNNSQVHAEALYPLQISFFFLTE